MPYLEEDLREQIARKKVIVIAGAGVSKAITRGKAPDWRTLIEKGIERCVALGRAPDPFWGSRFRPLLGGRTREWLIVADEIATYLKWRKEPGRSDGEWTNWLRETVGSLPICDKRLVSLMRRLGPIATLNYDDLIYRILGGDAYPIPWTRAARWQEVMDRRRGGVLHLHGCWREEESVVFGKCAYNILLREAVSQLFLKNLAERSLLFIGCGGTFEDPNFENLTEWMAKFGALETRHFVLVADREKAKAQDTCRGAAHIHVLPYGATHDELLPYLEDLMSRRPRPRFAPSAERRDVVGRDREIDELVGYLSADYPPPIAITGPAGSGLSTIARAALQEWGVVSRFGRRYRFVDCAILNSAMELRAKTEPIERVDDDSGGGDNRRLLILDNLETIWDRDRDKVEAALIELAGQPGLAIVATLRGQVMPRAGLEWRRVEVRPLGPDSSRELFLQRAGRRFAGDPWLDRLLAEAAGLPLFIALLAHAARDDPDLGVTWRRWQEQELRMLAGPSADGRLARLEASLELSITSRQTTEDARRLLALLGCLPAGMGLEDIENLLPGTGHATLDGLRESGLASIDPGRDRLNLPGPLRKYVGERYPPRDDDLRRAIRHYAGLARERGPRVTASSEDPDHRWFAAEDANIEAMLIKGLETEDSALAIEGAIGYGTFLVRAQRLDTQGLLRRAAGAASARGNHLAAAACWICDAKLAQIAGTTDGAWNSYRAARDAYRAAADARGEAEALAGLGETEEDRARAERYFQEALGLFIAADDLPNIALMRFQLALISPVDKKTAPLDAAWEAASRSGNENLRNRITLLRGQSGLPA